MGLSPEEFYKMDIEDFHLARSGFFNKRAHDESVFRKMAAILISPWSKQRIDEHQLWWIKGDEEKRKLHKEESDAKTMAILNSMSNVKYVKRNGVIVAEKTN